MKRLMFDYVIPSAVTVVLVIAGIRLNAWYNNKQAAKLAIAPKKEKPAAV